MTVSAEEIEQMNETKRGHNLKMDDRHNIKINDIVKI
jgi:hypothetical protein